MFGRKLYGCSLWLFTKSNLKEKTSQPWPNFETPHKALDFRLFRNFMVSIYTKRQTEQQSSKSVLFWSSVMQRRAKHSDPLILKRVLIRKQRWMPFNPFFKPGKTTKQKLSSILFLFGIKYSWYICNGTAALIYWSHFFLSR